MGMGHVKVICKQLMSLTKEIVKEPHHEILGSTILKGCWLLTSIHLKIPM